MKLSILTAATVLGAASLLSASAHAQMVNEWAGTFQVRSSLTQDGQIVTEQQTALAEMPPMPGAIVPMSAIGGGLAHQEQSAGTATAVQLKAFGDPLPAMN